MNTAVAQRSAGAAASTEQRALTPYEKFRTKLDSLRPEIAALVGKESVDRFVRVCLNSVQATPKLLDADRRTLLLACIKAAQDGLMPDGREAVFNIYWTKVKGEGGKDEWIDAVQYLPMVHGLVKKLYESEQVTFVDAVAVYEKDQFSYQRGDDPKIHHVPYAGDEEPGNVVAAYCVAKLKNGEVKREVMFRRDIEKVRDASKAKDGPGWTTWYDQFAIKSVIKRAYKQLPSYAGVEQVIASDNEALGINFQAGGDPGDLGGDPKIGASGLKAALTKSIKDAGTVEMRDKYLAKFAECKDTEILDLVRDEANAVDWTDADKAVIDAKYNELRTKLAAG